MKWIGVMEWFRTQRESGCDPQALAWPCKLQAEVKPDPARVCAQAAEQRLREAVQACLEGRLAEAELLLHQWHRHEDCPVEAVLLLACLLMNRSCESDALCILRQHEARCSLQEPALGQLIICVLSTTGLNEAARRTAMQLHHEHGNDPNVRLWLNLLQTGTTGDAQPLPDIEIDQLAGEIVHHPHLIPTLVVAQKNDGESHELELLRRALQRAARDLASTFHMPQVCLGLAELALLARDRDEARRWAHRGLALQPLSAPLALALAAAGDDPAMQPSTAQVLQDTVQAHPTYPDLRAALIRQYFASGRKRDAQIALHHWQQDQPPHALMQQLERELAA